MALFDEEGVVPTPEQVPGWMVAADNHNIGNNSGGSWLEPETWSDKFSGAGKLIATGMLSGANSFYNSGATIGRFIGATDAEDRDTGDWIANIDEDLGEYYRQNPGAADLVGFIASSLVPGVAGVKVLNAGQRALQVAADTGKLGVNLSRATKLLVPKTDLYVQSAAKEITQGMNVFNSINTSGVKALASGVTQNVLEGLAFETAVQATLFKSPILEVQDTGDIIKNIAIGGALGGVIGGAFSGAVSLGKIKSLVTAEQKKLLPLSSRTIIEPGTSPAAKIILMAEDAETAVMPLRTGTDDSNIAAATKLYNDKMRRIDLDIRDNINTMAKGTSVELSNMVADAVKGAGSKDVMNLFLHTEEIAPLKIFTKVENDFKASVKAGNADTALGVKYLKLTGEDAGKVLDSEPLVLNLADTVLAKKGQSLQEATIAAVRKNKFKVDDGFSTSNLTKGSGHLEAEARYLWARYLLKEIPDGATFRSTDIPLLERALQDGKLSINLTDDSGKLVQEGFDSADKLRNYIIETKQDIANRLIEKTIKKADVPLEFSTPAIAKIVNTKLARLEGTRLGEPSKDFFAMQTNLETYSKQLQGKGLLAANGEVTDPALLPSFAKISSRIPNDAMADGFVIDGLTYLKEQQKQFEIAASNVTARALGNLDELIPKITQEELMGANTSGVGATLFGFENSNYGTLGSTVAGIGSITKLAKQEFRQVDQNLLEGPLARLGNNAEAAIEHHVITQQVTRSGDLWKVAPGEERALVRKSALDKMEKSADEFEGFDPADLIPIKNKETYDTIVAEIENTSRKTVNWTELNAVHGRQTNKDPGVYRPIRPDLKQFPHFAFVKDPRVTGSGHTTLLHASSAGKLDELINSVKLNNPELSVLTKTESDDWFKARHEYEYERSLNENYINSELKNKGIFSEFYTKTDPQKIVNDILQSHLRDSDVLVTELVRLKNQAAFDWLEDQGKQFTKIEASQFGGSLSKIEREGKNPYTDYIKTALDISKVSEYPLIYGINKQFDSAVSNVVARINDIFSKSKTPEEMIGINETLEKYGMNTAYRNAATDLLVNHTAPRGELTKFVRGANALLSKLTLGLDPLNAINNFIGANVLRGTELTQLTRAIASGDTKIAGELAKLAKVNLPGGVGSILAPTKLVKNALAAYVGPGSKELVARYTEAGYIKGISAQFHSILDDFTLKGTETVADLNSRIQRAFTKTKELSEVGEKLTGNQLAEEMNRFLSANVMDQLTTLAKKNGLLSDAEAHSYINTFVNRVEGNTIASQRPIIFQGPIGQAIGLFQSYQFNLLQQMFRYVAEGSKKDAAMLLGLQSTFFGLQGLPAFQFINQHVVGTASGNTEHRDLYDGILGIGGKNVGEFLLYGLPSNILQTNLYTRGDINPRQVTVIPTAPAEVPFIGAFGKFLGSVKETATKISGGAPVWESMLQGLEHNGLSRPMAGLAQTLQAFGSGGKVYSTSNKGTIISSNDLFSWATATRLIGGRPLDEAVVNDAVFRIHAYTQYNRSKMMSLAERVKTSVIAGNVPEDEAIAEFASGYAASGGKQVNFNQWMMNQYKNANTPESERLAGQLANPLAQKAQLLMGGAEF